MAGPIVRGGFLMHVKKAKVIVGPLAKFMHISRVKRVSAAKKAKKIDGKKKNKTKRPNEINFTVDWHQRRDSIQQLLTSYRKHRDMLKRFGGELCNSGTKLQREIINSINSDPILNKLINKMELGPIQGIKVGDSFYWRGELIVAGLHNNLGRGIVVTRVLNKVFAATIVESGRYKDNIEQIISSPRFQYIGEGRRNQKLTMGNAALVQNTIDNEPVKVVCKIKDINPIND